MRALIGIMAIVANAGLAWATADGPDFWRVTGVAANDVLNMRARATWKESSWRAASRARQTSCSRS